MSSRWQIRLAPLWVLSLVTTPGSTEGPAARAVPTCAAAELIMTRFPLDGSNGRDWMINNYVDLDDASPGLRDYTNNAGELARTYDGHRGLDIDIPSFREMDGDAAVIYAAAPGIIDEVIQDQPDRNTSCAGTWNVVGVRHANGFHVLYGHIKRGSARVIVGQTVAAGTPLAIAGSAGCSTQPHLHLEVRTCADVAVETLRPPGMWSRPPVYDPPSDIMDVMLRDGTVPTVEQIKDPAPNPSVIAPDGTLGVGLSAAARGGDVIAVNLIHPDGRRSTQTSIVEGDARFTHVYPRFALAIGAATGTWTVEIFVNDVRRATRTIEVSASGVRRLAKLRRRPALARAVVFCRRHALHPSSTSASASASTGAGVAPRPVPGCHPGRCAGRPGAGARPRSLPKPRRPPGLHRGPGRAGARRLAETRPGVASAGHPRRADDL